KGEVRQIAATKELRVLPSSDREPSANSGLDIETENFSATGRGRSLFVDMPFYRTTYLRLRRFRAYHRQLGNCPRSPNHRFKKYKKFEVSSDPSEVSPRFPRSPARTTRRPRVPLSEKCVISAECTVSRQQ